MCVLIFVTTFVRIIKMCVLIFVTTFVRIIKMCVLIFVTTFVRIIKMCVLNWKYTIFRYRSCTVQQILLHYQELQLKSELTTAEPRKTLCSSSESTASSECYPVLNKTLLHSGQHKQLPCRSSHTTSGIL